MGIERSALVKYLLNLVLPENLRKQLPSKIG